MNKPNQTSPPARNPPVWTCRNTFKPVETRSDLLKHVSRSPPSPSIPSPSSPFSPFFWGGGGGREGEGGGREGEHYHGPPGRGGGRSPPPSPDFNKKLSKFSHSFFSLCNLPTLKVSLSPQLKTTKLMAASQQNSLWHTEMIWNLKAPLNIIIIIIISLEKKNFLLSVYARWWWSNGENIHFSFFLSVFLLLQNLCNFV